MINKLLNLIIQKKNLFLVKHKYKKIYLLRNLRINLETLVNHNAIVQNKILLRFKRMGRIPLILELVFFLLFALIF